MVWPSWFRTHAHAYAPIVTRDETGVVVPGSGKPPLHGKPSTARPPLLLHHFVKPSHRHRDNATRRRVVLGAVCLLALIALLVVTLSRIGAAQAAGRGDVMKNLRNALAAACAAANKTTVMFLTQITRTSRNAAKGLLEVISFKSIWGVDRRTRVQSPFGDADSASTQFLSLAKRFRKRFVVPTLQAFVAVAAFLSALVAADRMFHFYVAVYWRRIRKQDPAELRWKSAELPPAESVSAQTISQFPKVVVQVRVLKAEGRRASPARAPVTFTGVPCQFETAYW
jgi:hypothetical protein